MAILSINPPHDNSLARRLFLFGFLGAAILLAISSYILLQVNKNAVENAYDKRLQSYVRILTQDLSTNLDDNEQNLGAILSEPLFDLPSSGWYWQINRLDKPELFTSRSVWTWNLQSSSKNTQSEYKGYITGPENQNLRVLERVVELERLGKFRIIVAGNAQEIFDNTTPFKIALSAISTLLAAAFLIGAYLQVLYGLKPLQTLTSALSNIRNGKTEHLEGDFPKEVQPLTQELNALIETNKNIVERARTHVGNLAHALKTPLSVLQNEAQNNPHLLSQHVLEQTDMMKQQVNQHLERAKLAARVQYVSTILEVAPLLKSLSKTLEKINFSKDISISTELDKSIKWRGEANDMLEMSGNIIDNAVKWAKSQVFVSLNQEPDDHFSIIIDDDGKGLTLEQRDLVGKRGLRLDESTKGSGLGLSIASDLASLYRGNLTLEPSPLGGLRVIITLPKVVQ